MPDSTLRATLNALQKQMLIKFNEVTKQIEHRGAKGREREALIAKDYLDHYMPAGVTVIHGGEILDSEGNRSAECDLIVQASATPPLYSTETFQIVPVEWAYGLIEVKSNLNSAELRDSHAKILGAKELKKLTYRPQTGDVTTMISAYGKNYDHFPMYGLVFAYNSINLSTLANELWTLQQGEPYENWVDAVVVLNKGLLMYQGIDGMRDVRPSPGCKLAVVESDTALLPMTLFIQTAFSGAWMSPASLGAYLGPEPWGQVTELVG